VEADDAIAARFTFAGGEPMHLRLGDRIETLRAVVDPIGQRTLTSEETDATLIFTADERVFTVIDVLGARSSVLHLVQLALARVPFEVRAGLTWTDHLDSSEVSGDPLGAVVRWLGDGVRPYLPTGGLEMVYEQRLEDDLLVVEGRSSRSDRQGRPWLSTRAALHPRRGLVEVEVTRGERVRSARTPTAEPAAPRSEEIRA